MSGPGHKANSCGPPQVPGLVLAYWKVESGSRVGGCWAGGLVLGDWSGGQCQTAGG